MLATDALREDHARVRDLFDKLSSSGTVSVDAEEGVFVEIAALLRAHARIEEEIFYLALAKAANNVRSPQIGLLDEAIDDHRDVDALITELMDMRPGDDEWETKLRELRDAVEAHVEMEENKMFPLAEHLLDEADLERIADELDVMKEDLLGPADIASAAELEEGMIARS
jgi:hemerythrin superfamily protein